MQTEIEQDGCWTCDKWGFTLFFWNEKVGKYNDVNKIGVERETLISLVKTIRMQNPDIYLGMKDVPVMFSNVTDWKPKPFLRLLDFLNSVEPIAEPEYDKVALEDAQSKFEFDQWDELADELQQEVKDYMES